jgi:hypothetical protein
MRQEREEVFLKNVSNKIRVNPLDQFYPCSKKMNTDWADSRGYSRIKIGPTNRSALIRLALSLSKGLISFIRVLKKVNADLADNHGYSRI